MMMRPSGKELMEAALDITEPLHGVEIVVKQDKSVIWVNIDGVCILRVCRIKHLDVKQ